MQQWLHKEIAYSEAGSLRPVYTEMEFGRGSTNLMPLEINGRRIFLNGKIDRIDRAGNSFYITDYKSSQAPKKADFLDTNLQLPLYILAADRLVAAKEGGTVTGGGAEGRGTEGKLSVCECAGRETSLADLFRNAGCRREQDPDYRYNGFAGKNGTGSGRYPALYGAGRVPSHTHGQV